MNAATLIDRIIVDLTRDPLAAYEQAERGARAAFLEWAMSLPDDVDLQRAARMALIAVDRLERPTVAVELFKSYLEEATQALPKPVRRGGSLRARSSSH